MREQAMGYFHGVEGYNCCQAVLKTYQESHGVSEEVIIDAKRFGGGRAPGNICGALHALYMLEPQKEELFTEAFQKKIGSHLCKDIRGKKLLSCRGCVGVASDIFTDSAAKN